MQFDQLKRREFITLLGGEPRAQVFVLGDDYCAVTHDARFN